jgi:hypothetical protein
MVRPFTLCIRQQNMRRAGSWVWLEYRDHGFHNESASCLANALLSISAFSWVGVKDSAAMRGFAGASGVLAQMFSV